MLDTAAKYESQLKELFAGIALDIKYKYYVNGVYIDEYEAHKSTWGTHEFVSIHNGKIIGHISYNINRTTDIVTEIGIINFSDDKFTFGRDVVRVIDDIFVKFNLRKIKYSVVTGNPIETTYDKLTEKYGGRIVGTYKDDVKLIDGEICDFKLYELFREDYLKHRRVKHDARANPVVGK